MSDLDLANLRRVAVASAAAVTGLQAATAVVSLRKGRVDWADGIWGPGLAAVAVTGAVVGNGDRVRRWTTAGLVSAGAERLAHQMIGRFRSTDEVDPRYQEFLEGDSTPVVVGKVFGTQALAQLIVSAPIQLAAASALPRTWRRWLFPLGAALTVAGGVTEALADRQKSAYSAIPKEQRPDVLDTGLWGWSRHPNYFGDSVVWDGVWVSSAASAPALVTLPAPVAMSYFLIFATGAKRTEKRMQERRGYRDYQKHVAFFFPRPQKKRG